MDFAGRSVVLTGVGREGQVGEAVATAFAELGARVFLVDRQESEARARADALVASGRRAAGLGVDLTDENAVAALAERVRDATGGRVHALVHLAGGFVSSGPVVESDSALWNRQFALNATTAYLTARAFLPLLRASKGALVALMQSIAQEEAPRGVRANAVAPTSIGTAANLAAMGPDAAYVTREDVAKVVLWLCSEEARAVNGQTIPVR